MFLKIDDWLFDKVFQPFSDWFCDRTGRSSFWLAATGAYLLLAGTIVMFTIFDNSFSEKISLSLTCLVALYFAREFDKRDGVERNKTMNPRRVFLPFLFYRLSGIGVGLFLLYDLFRADGDMVERITRLCLHIIFLCSFYFSACETKPPAPPKKKEVRSGKFAPSTT